MVNKYIEAFFERLYVRYYLHYENWKAEIIQIMWEALYEARKRYRRYAGVYDLEEYAEKAKSGILVLSRTKAAFKGLRDNFTIGERG